MNAVMPDIIKHSERTDIAPHVKDGYIMMFIYMPSVFPDEFTKYIGQVILRMPDFYYIFQFHLKAHLTISDHWTCTESIGRRK